MPEANLWPAKFCTGWKGISHWVKKVLKPSVPRVFLLPIFENRSGSRKARSGLMNAGQG
jgi:hypothetical protein